MHMRFVRLQVKKGRLTDVRRFYKDTVIPAFQETEGCLFASLLQPTGESDESVSMTLWASREHADAYEESGLFDELLDESDDFLADATEWRVRLTGDRGGPISTLQDPEIENYQVEVAAERETGGTTPSTMHVNILSVRVEPGRFAQLVERYNQLVVPEMMSASGCRAVFLVEGLKARSRALSVTVWDSEAAAIRWQRTGKLRELTARLSEFFSGLYKWELSLSGDRRGKGITPSDLDISEYHVITGSRLRESENM
jgi:heme-degrading monooxygenase HmoA